MGYCNYTRPKTDWKHVLFHLPPLRELRCCWGLQIPSTVFHPFNWICPLCHSYLYPHTSWGSRTHSFGRREDAWSCIDCFVHQSISLGISLLPFNAARIDQAPHKHASIFAHLRRHFTCIDHHIAPRLDYSAWINGLNMMWSILLLRWSSQHDGAASLIAVVLNQLFVWLFSRKLNRYTEDIVEMWKLEVKKCVKRETRRWAE